MANVYINSIGVPRKTRSGRIYSGNSFNSTNAYYSSTIGSGGGGQKHIEAGRIENITNANVYIYFTTAFNTNPVGYVKARRFTEFAPGLYGFTDVLFTYSVLMVPYGVTKFGFQILIDASENLTGVVIEYMFTE